MNFRTTSTIEEQMSHVKKYAPLLLLNIPRKYQYLLYSIPFLAIFVQLRTSEHRSMYSYVRLSIDRCTATYV